MNVGSNPCTLLVWPKETNLTSLDCVSFTCGMFACGSNSSFLLGTDSMPSTVADTLHIFNLTMSVIDFLPPPTISDGVDQRWTVSRPGRS